MTKLAPEWVQTSDPVIRSPARYRWTTAPADLSGGELPTNANGRMSPIRAVEENIYLYPEHDSQLIVYIITSTPVKRGFRQYKAPKKAIPESRRDVCMDGGF